MVLAAAGGINHSHLVDIAQKYFGDLKTLEDDFVIEPGQFVPSYVILFLSYVFFYLFLHFGKFPILFSHFIRYFLAKYEG